MGATRSNPITASNQKLKASPDADRCAPPRFRARPLALIGDDITNSAPAQQRVECVPAVWPGGCGYLGPVAPARRFKNKAGFRQEVCRVWLFQPWA